MRAEVELLGTRVNMARRSRRRVLVAAIYGGLAVLIALLWWGTHWRGTGVYVFWAAMLACRFFLGGYYRGGLVKPFQYRRPVNAAMPPTLLALKLRVYQPVLEADEDGFRNDERELNQRDRAHYMAYQAIGMAGVLEAFGASMRIGIPRLQAWMTMPADQMYYGFSLVTLTLFLTLPQAILLWTEPDMEAEAAGSRGRFPVTMRRQSCMNRATLHFHNGRTQRGRRQNARAGRKKAGGSDEDHRHDRDADEAEDVQQGAGAGSGADSVRGAADVG